MGVRQTVQQILRADQVYYDAERNRAIAMTADLELAAANLPDSIHLKGNEIWRLGVDEWRIRGAETASSKLPTDPGLKLTANDVSLVTQQVILRNAFGMPYRDIRRARRCRAPSRSSPPATRDRGERRAGVLHAVLPDRRERPARPVPGIGLGHGPDLRHQLYTTWDMFKLLAPCGAAEHNWRLHLDYLSYRGPGAGTDYDYTLPGLDPAGASNRLPTAATGSSGCTASRTRGWTCSAATAGRSRRPRGSAAASSGGTGRRSAPTSYFQGQVASVSDQNFLEQYYKNEWDIGPEPGDVRVPHLAARQLRGQRAGRAEGRPAVDRRDECRCRRCRASLIGQSFFDLFVYNGRGPRRRTSSPGPAQDNPYPVLPTDVP